MKNIKKYIPLIIVLVIAGLGFAFRENIARAVRGDAYVDNKYFTNRSMLLFIAHLLGFLNY